MDRNRFSKIRHSSLAICSPLCIENVVEIGKELGPLPGGRLLELGCGKAEILARLLEATFATGVGVDLPGSLAEELSPLAATQRNSGKLELRFQDARDFSASTVESFDAVVLVGASQAIGGLDGLSSVAKKLLRPGGRLVLGELAWSRKPDAGFLDTMGMREEDLPRISDIPGFLLSMGFKERSWRPVPGDQFLQYEKSLRENARAYARSRPGDPEAQEAGAQAENWFELMSSSGLSFFSFGWGLFDSWLS